MLPRLNLIRTPLRNHCRTISQRRPEESTEQSRTESDHSNTEVKEHGEQKSERMKKFHEKLKLQPVPTGVAPGMRFIDLVLVETDPKSGELIPNAEKDPTKWGDWQNGGRVSDF